MTKTAVATIAFFTILSYSQDVETSGESPYLQSTVTIVTSHPMNDEKCKLFEESLNLG